MGAEADKASVDVQAEALAVRPGAEPEALAGASGEPVIPRSMRVYQHLGPDQATIDRARQLAHLPNLDIVWRPWEVSSKTGIGRDSEADALPYQSHLYPICRRARAG